MIEFTEKITRLSPFEEAIGVLHSLQELDGYCLANIGPVCVSLPEDMASKLKGMQGQKIGVLRTDCDYRFRVCDQRPS
jgi:O-succinylbenzoate synthase